MRACGTAGLREPLHDARGTIIGERASTACVVPPTLVALVVIVVVVEAQDLV